MSAINLALMIIVIVYNTLKSGTIPWTDGIEQPSSTSSNIKAGYAPYCGSFSDITFYRCCKLIWYQKGDCCSVLNSWQGCWTAFGWESSYWDSYGFYSCFTLLCKGVPVSTALGSITMTINRMCPWQIQRCVDTTILSPRVQPVHRSPYTKDMYTKMDMECITTHTTHIQIITIPILSSTHHPATIHI